MKNWSMPSHTTDTLGQICNDFFSGNLIRILRPQYLPITKAFLRIIFNYKGRFE